MDNSSVDPARWRSPRIRPGTAREVGLVNYAIVRLSGLLAGGAPPNVFSTLARHRGLFRKWLVFASALMPGGALPRSDSELLILRVATNTDCLYEWRQHERIARAAGLSAEQVRLVRRGPAAEGWSPRQMSMLRAADELHEHRMISDELWGQLSGHCRDTELIEVCMLVGQYEMLAMTLNTLRVAPDAVRDEPSRAMRVLGRVRANRRAPGRERS